MIDFTCFVYCLCFLIPPSSFLFVLLWLPVITLETSSKFLVTLNMSIPVWSEVQNCWPSEDGAGSYEVSFQNMQRDLVTLAGSSSVADFSRDFLTGATSFSQKIFQPLAGEGALVGSQYAEGREERQQAGQESPRAAGDVVTRAPRLASSYYYQISR